MRPEVMENVTELLKLQELREAESKIADKARAVVQHTHDEIEKRLSKPGDFGVGRNVQEQYYRLDDGRIVRVTWRAPTVGPGDGTAEVRLVKIEEAR